MFVAKNKVRIHDMDMAGLLYFPRQFRFVNDALEDFLESEGLPFDYLFHKEDFVFVIVHCESHYLEMLELDNRLEVHVGVEKIGNTSFTLFYNIYREDGTEVGAAKTTHVCLSRSFKKKIPVPGKLLPILEKHLGTPPALR